MAQKPKCIISGVIEIVKRPSSKGLDLGFNLHCKVQKA